MGAKVNFNEITKIITVTLAPVDGEVFIDVKEDLYSDGKEDWVLNENLRKFIFPVESVGGNPLPGSKELGTTFFLASDWKIRPYEASHKLVINGNLYSEDGSDPFLDTLGTFTVRIIQQVSSLVDSTVQQLPEIEFASFNGGVTIDILSGHSGIDYPIGTQQEPVNNMFDALLIAESRGLTTFYILGDIVLNDSLSFIQYTFIGESITKSKIIVDPDADVTKCEFYECTITGTLDGKCKVKNCLVKNINYISGYIELCLLEETLLLGGASTAYFVDCWAGETGLLAPPIIDMGGSGQKLVLQNFNGKIKIQNMTGENDSIGMSINAGWIVLDSSITNGNIHVVGIGSIDDYTTENALVDTSRLLSTNFFETLQSEIVGSPGKTNQELYAKVGFIAKEF